MSLIWLNTHGQIRGLTSNRFDCK